MNNSSTQQMTPDQLGLEIIQTLKTRFPDLSPSAYAEFQQEMVNDLSTWMNKHNLLAHQSETVSSVR